MVTLIISLLINLITGTTSPTTPNNSNTIDSGSTNNETITTFGGSSGWANE